MTQRCTDPPVPRSLHPGAIGLEGSEMVCPTMPKEIQHETWHKLCRPHGPLVRKGKSKSGSPKMGFQTGAFFQDRYTKMGLQNGHLFANKIPNPRSKIKNPKSIKIQSCKSERPSSKMKNMCFGFFCFGGRMM